MIIRETFTFPLGLGNFENALRALTKTREFGAIVGTHAVPPHRHPVISWMKYCLVESLLCRAHDSASADIVAYVPSCPAVDATEFVGVIFEDLK